MEIFHVQGLNVFVEGNFYVQDCVLVTLRLTVCEGPDQYASTRLGKQPRIKCLLSLKTCSHSYAVGEARGQ